MSWLELDDGILEHPKFIRAANLGGSEAIHLWLGLRAYCGKHLTDGEIPLDMLDEVRGPVSKKKRDAALRVLFDVGLIEDLGTVVLMHDFLDWSASRDEVLAARERTRLRKAKSRTCHTVTDAVTPNGVTPSVTLPSPSPLHSSPLLFPDDSGSASPPAKPKARRWRKFPVDFEPDESIRLLAVELGVDLAAELTQIRDYEFKDPKSDPAATLRTWLRNAKRFAQRSLPTRVAPPRQPNSGYSPSAHAREIT